MKKLSVLLTLVALLALATSVFAADTLTYTAEVTVPSASFVYKGSTDDLVVPVSTNVANGTAYGKTNLNYGEVSGQVLSATFLASDLAVAHFSGDTVDTIKIISMPTTTNDLSATVVYSLTTTFKATFSEITKLSNTKLVIVYKTATSATKMYAQTITVNAPMTTLTLSTGNPNITIVSSTVTPVVSRVSATKAVIRYNDASDTLSQVYNTASDTVETATMAFEGTTSVLATDKFSADFIFISKIAGVPTIVTETNADTTSMASGYNVDLTFLESTVEIGDIVQLDTTHAVYVYREGTNTYMQTVDFTTEDTGTALLVGTNAVGTNFNVDKMLVKLNETHVVLSVNGQTRLYKINLTTHVITIAGIDTAESQTRLAPAIYNVYADTVTTNPAIFKTFYDRPTTNFRKNSYINYTSTPRVGYVATGASAGSTVSVQLNGVITKSNSVTSGINLYVANDGSLAETSAGCTDVTPVGVKLRTTSILLK